MRYAIVEFFPKGYDPEVILALDPDGFPMIFSSNEEAEEWAQEGNYLDYRILEF